MPRKLPENYQKTTDKILELLRENPLISRRKISEILRNISEHNVKYYLDKLKQEGTIKRVGGDKGGSWKILAGNS